MRSLTLLTLLLACDDGDPASPVDAVAVDGSVDAGPDMTPALAPTDRTARACEVTFTDPIGAVQVTFGPGVRGRSLTQKPRTAAAFIATSNLPFGPDAITVDGPVEVISSQCFDAAGQLIPDARVEL